VNQAHSSRRSNLVAVAFLGALLIALFYPTLRWLISEWLGNDYYSHGPLVPVISGVLAWRLWMNWPAAARRLQGDSRGLIPAMLGLGVYLYALIERAYFVGSLAIIPVIAGLVWFLLGAAVLRRQWFPIAFLVFMVPLPFVEPLSVPMAQFTGGIAAGVVKLLGVPITVNGAQVTLPNAALVVGAQCSGLRSIVTLLTLVTLVIFVVEGKPWATGLLALTSIPIAVLGNVLRVASLLVVANIWGADAGFKYYHDYSGIVFFASALGLLLLASWLLGCREIREDIF
jgi:exosortase